MGTRHLIMVIHKEETKIAQYGQWDGYPSGQGVTVLNFLKKVKIDKFKEKLKNVRFMNEDDEKKLSEFMESIGVSDGWMDMEQAAKYHKAYPYMTRNVGAEILNMVYKSKGDVLLQDSTSFANDSLFCEWAYVIDLDKNQLEVYEGFNKTELEKSQRFEYMDGEGDYFPIRCIKIYPLDDLPTPSKFVKELQPKEEEA